MRTTEGGPCLRRGPGFWFGTGPHTPAQRVWPTRAPLRSQDGDTSSGRAHTRCGMARERRNTRVGAPKSPQRNNAPAGVKLPGRRNCRPCNQHGPQTLRITMDSSASFTIRPPQNAPRDPAVCWESLLHALPCARGGNLADVQTPACPASDHSQLVLTAVWDQPSLRPCVEEVSE